MTDDQTGRPRHDIVIVVDNRHSTDSEQSWSAYLRVDGETFTIADHSAPLGFGKDPASAVQHLVEMVLGRVDGFEGAFYLEQKDLEQHLGWD